MWDDDGGRKTTKCEGAPFQPRSAARVLMRALVAVALIVLGLLACAYGLLIWASIGRSDTATGVLVGFGFTFAMPGLVAIGVGAWLLRRRRPRT